MAPPVWVMIEREDDIITGYYSHNGQDWIRQPDGTGFDATTNPRAIQMDTNVYIGLCVTSHAAGELRTFTFDNVSVTGTPLTAFNPSPADGALHQAAQAHLQWTAGATAASHNVYFGDNFNDVEAGTGGTFQGNQTSTSFDVGLIGQPFPNGLVSGTTYYWRIDEVGSDGWSIHTGNVWSFTTAPVNAYDPNPLDGSKFVDRNITLSWTTGFGDVSHNVYFGENFDDVNDGTGGTFQGNQQETAFNVRIPYPNGLASDTTSFWRIDEVEADSQTIHKGGVWSFTATLPGLGSITLEKWNNIYGSDLNTLKNHWSYPDNPDETWVISQFDSGIELDENYGGRIHGWLYAPLTGDYTFWICSDDDGELWLSTDDSPENTELIAYVSGWAPPYSWNKFTSQESNPVLLKAGDKYYIMAIWKEGDTGDHCQVAWQGPGIPTRMIIPGNYLSTEPVGTYPKPDNGASIGNKTPTLSWAPSRTGVKYDVYLGTNLDLVTYADRWDASSIYRGRFEENSYTTDELEAGHTYYWRIDEVEADGMTIYKGTIWSFTVIDAVTVEYIVSSSRDDGFAINEETHVLGFDFLTIGESGSEPPYYTSGMVFRNVDIPQGTEIISSNLRICSHINRLTSTVYGKIEAEAVDNADAFGISRRIGSLPKTSASVNWDHHDPWAENTWYQSPDIAEVIQEIIDRPGWTANNSLTILYGTRLFAGDWRKYSSYDRGIEYAPRLEITYAP